MEEFLEALLVLPPAPASRCRWHGAEQKGEGSLSRVRAARAMGQQLDTASTSGQPPGALQVCSEGGQCAILDMRLRSDGSGAQIIVLV